jgi:hypothetical protein
MPMCGYLLNIPFVLSLQYQEVGLALSNRARVQRGSSETARCASTGNRQAGLLSHPIVMRRGVAGLSFTARIGRAPFHRARSASKKDGLVGPFPPFYLSGLDHDG